MKDPNFIEFFIDITFEIIPRVYKSYKLMTIAGLDKLNNKTMIICFIFIKYLENITYYRTFKYLKENYDFNPKIIHTDFENSLSLAIKNCEFFDKNLIQIKCFFNFLKAVVDKLKKLGLFTIVKKNQ